MVYIAVFIFCFQIVRMTFESVSESGWKTRHTIAVLMALMIAKSFFHVATGTTEHDRQTEKLWSEYYSQASDADFSWKE